MSFQDVGKRNSQRPVATGGMSSAAGTGGGGRATATTPSSVASAWGSLSIPSSTAMTQISDSLTQYQVCYVQKVFVNKQQQQ
jgi:hypothetical protein